MVNSLGKLQVFQSIVEEVIKNKYRTGFTLIELMVVIVIIGILSALAVPKMNSVSAKAKAAEAPSELANWESLQNIYCHENGIAGSFTDIGYQDHSSTLPGGSKWFDYTDGGNGPTSFITATLVKTFGACSNGDTFKSDVTAVGGVLNHTSTGGCAVAYAPNF